MKAITIDILFKGGRLVLSDMEIPQIKPDEVLVKVAFAGVNRPDVLQRQGGYPPPADATKWQKTIPGLEISGEIVALGKDVKNFAVGDCVFGLVTGGGYSAYCAAPEACCLPLPPALSLKEAAALPETCFTVFYNVFMQANLQKGEWLLVHGGSSGIGTTAIAMAKLAGAKIIVTAGSDEKCRACVDLGADFAINYRCEDFVAQTMAYTQNAGVTCILDMVGGAYVDKNYQCAADQCTIVQIAFLQGAKAQIDLALMMRKRICHRGSTLRNRSLSEKSAIIETFKQRFWPCLEQGLLKPKLDTVFALEDAMAAHALMESGKNIGKIVLVL